MQSRGVLAFSIHSLSAFPSGWVRHTVITHPWSNLPWVRTGPHPRLSSLAYRRLRADWGRLQSHDLEFQARSHSKSS